MSQTCIKYFKYIFKNFTLFKKSSGKLRVVLKKITAKVFEITNKKGENIIKTKSCIFKD